MRRRLLHGMACGDALASLLAAKQAERRRGHKPIGQDRESPPARLTYSAAHPNTFVPVVMSMPEAPSMADDGAVPTDRTLSREKIQGDYPGSALSFVSGSAIKRITAGVRACRWVLPARTVPATGLHPPGRFVFERKTERSPSRNSSRLPDGLAGIKGLPRINPPC
jgi:hypothetical protein